MPEYYHVPSQEGHVKNEFCRMPFKINHISQYYNLNMFFFFSLLLNGVSFINL